MIRIVFFDKATKRLRAQLEPHTLGPEFAMASWLTWSKHLSAVVLYDDDRVIGWSGMDRDNLHEAELGVFVDEAYRGQGLGRLVVEALLYRVASQPKHHKDVWVEAGHRKLYDPLLKRYGFVGHYEPR